MVTERWYLRVGKFAKIQSFFLRLYKVLTLEIKQIKVNINEKKSMQITKEVAMEKPVRELQINPFQKITLNSAKAFLTFS